MSAHSRKPLAIPSAAHARAVRAMRRFGGLLLAGASLAAATAAAHTISDWHSFPTRNFPYWYKQYHSRVCLFEQFFLLSVAITGGSALFTAWAARRGWLQIRTRGFRRIGGVVFLLPLPFFFTMLFFCNDHGSFASPNVAAMIELLCLALVSAIPIYLAVPAIRRPAGEQPDTLPDPIPEAEHDARELRRLGRILLVWAALSCVLFLYAASSLLKVNWSLWVPPNPLFSYVRIFPVLTYAFPVVAIAATGWLAAGAAGCRRRRGRYVGYWAGILFLTSMAALWTVHGIIDDRHLLAKLFGDFQGVNFFGTTAALYTVGLLVCRDR